MPSSARGSRTCTRACAQAMCAHTHLWAVCQQCCNEARVLLVPAQAQQRGVTGALKDDGAVLLVPDRQAGRQADGQAEGLAARQPGRQAVTARLLLSGQLHTVTRAALSLRYNRCLHILPGEEGCLGARSAVCAAGPALACFYMHNPQSPTGATWPRCCSPQVKHAHAAVRRHGRKHAHAAPGNVVDLPVMRDQLGVDSSPLNILSVVM